MQRRYEYIHFILEPDHVWSCRNNKHGDELGQIKWYPRWKRWCYFPTVQAVYSAGCLEDIQHFIGQLMEKLPGGKNPTDVEQLVMELQE